MLNDWLKLNNEEPTSRSASRRPKPRSTAKAYAQYPKLTESEIKTLVVDDKWLAA